MGIELIYNVVLVSGVQQSDSVIHIRTHVCVCLSQYLVFKMSLRFSMLFIIANMLEAINK